MNTKLNPILAALASNKHLMLAVNGDDGADFLLQVHNNTKSESLNTETGRREAFKLAMSDVLGYVGLSYQDDDYWAPYNLAEGCAIIPVHGGLINRFNSTWGFVTGYNYIKYAINKAIEDDRVNKIVLDVNSGGGQVAGCFETSQFIREASDIKPVYAIVDSSCYSAAYALASAATEIYATPSAGVGSIGIICVHFSLQQMYKNDGIEVTTIKAGDKKDLGSSYKDLSEEDIKDLQADVDVLYGEFVKLVSENRGLSSDDIIKTQASCYTSTQALELGLIDAVMTVEQAFEKLTLEDNNMSKQNDGNTIESEVKPESNSASVEQVDSEMFKSAERGRIQAILGDQAASQNRALAEHLAFSTDMTAEAAVAVLNAAIKNSPKEATVEQKTVEHAVQPDVNMLAAAMVMQGSPNVGADANDDNGNIDLSAVAEFANSH